MSSSLRYEQFKLPRGCQQPSSRTREARFILVLGTMAGDFWHCAAVSILSRHRLLTNREYPFEDYEFVVCIVVGMDGKGELLPKWAAGGKKMFEYFQAIGVACMAIKASKRGNGGTEPTIQTLNDADVKSAWALQAKNAGHTFDDILSGKNALVKGDGNVETSECLLRYDAGTSALMQLVKYFGPKTSQEILAHGLTCKLYMKNKRLRPRVPEQRRADNRIDAIIVSLEATLRRVRAKSPATTRTLLFNYRHTTYNVQHNANSGILTQVTELAARYDITVVILPTMDGQYLEKESLPGRDDVFYLYERPGKTRTQLSYRDKALFWARVAQNAERWGLVGLMGGRSGTMDLAAFVGVRCLSWDEPFFQVEETFKQGSKWTFRGKIPGRKKVPKEETHSGDDEQITDRPQKKRRASSMSTSGPAYNANWTGNWAASQGRQILRLLNQVEIMHVSFLKRSALQVVQQGKESLRPYAALEEQDWRLVNFLRGTNNAPSVGLGYEAKAGWTIYAIGYYRKKLESPQLGVRAINLAEYSDLAKQMETHGVDGNNTSKDEMEEEGEYEDDDNDDEEDNDNDSESAGGFEIVPDQEDEEESSSDSDDSEDDDDSVDDDAAEFSGDE